MITFHPFHLELSLPVAMALLAFASKDDYRAHLGIGIEDGAVGATDGHTAVLFEACAVEDGGNPAAHDRRVWSRATVETAVKVARAHKAKTVTLQYGLFLDGPTFPPLRQVLPEDGISGNDCAIGFNPKYVGQLSLVAKACGAEGVKLTALRGGLDPLGFRATGTESVTARAAVMPMRI